MDRLNSSGVLCSKMCLASGSGGKCADGQSLHGLLATFVVRFGHFGLGMFMLCFYRFHPCNTLFLISKIMLFVLLFGRERLDCQLTLIFPEIFNLAFEVLVAATFSASCAVVSAIFVLTCE